MKGEGNRMALMFIPSKKGIIKVHIFGFHFPGAWGQVFAELNGITVNSKGYNRKKTIIQGLAKLHETLLK